MKNPYDAYLLMIGVAYVKIAETSSKKKKEQYQKVIDSLMEEMRKI